MSCCNLSQLPAAELGRIGEDEAIAIYQDRGYTLLERNVRYPHGELDAVLKAPDGSVVFLEVKTRRDHYFGGADSITPAKWARWRKAAATWLRDNPGYSFRFDVMVLYAMGDVFGMESYEGVTDAAS